MAPKTYDTTVARIAGNIASGMVQGKWISYDPPIPVRTELQYAIAETSVAIARLIIAETQKTEPSPALDVPTTAR